jgi:hypothetical protein
LLSSPRDLVLVPGEALQCVLLTAARHGVYASIYTQALEVPVTRARLSGLTYGLQPQMLLQLGYADHGHLTREFRDRLGFTPSHYRREV